MRQGIVTADEWDTLIDSLRKPLPSVFQINSRSLMIHSMIDDQDLGFFANFLGVFIFVLVAAYHMVMADPKFEGN